MKTRIDIDTKTFVRFWLVVIGLGLLILALWTASTALIILGTSFFLALALNKPVSSIAKRLPGKSRVGATALSYVAVLAFLGAIVFLVVPPIVQQTARFASTIPALVESGTTQFAGLQGFIDEYNLQPQLDEALVSIQNSAAGWASNVGQSVITGIGSFFAFLTATILVLVLTFLMLVEGPKLMTRIWNLYVDRDRMLKHKKVVGKMYNVVSGYVTGQLTVSAIGAFFAGLAVFILSIIFTDIPGNLAFPTAAIGFVLALIPMFGSTIAGVIITLLIALSSLPAAIIYAVYFFIYQQVENNFIAPHIQAKRIELSALTVLASVTIGLYMFGIVGGIIAIPIAGAIRVLVEQYLDDRAKDRRDNSKTKLKPAA